MSVSLSPLPPALDFTACAGNPLLDFSDLPRFAAIRPAHISPALDLLLAHATATLEHVIAPDTPAGWETVVTPLEEATDFLGRAWGIVGHLKSVVDTEALRAVHGENLPRVTQFWSSLGQSLALYQKYQALRNSPAYDALTPTRQKILNDALRDFRLSGAGLDEALKPSFMALQERQATLCKQFADHALDATNAYIYRVLGETELEGLPDDDRAAARAAAEEKGESGWHFTLHFPSYFPVMQYATHRPLREALYRAYVTRASELGPEYGQGQAAWDNTQIIKEQLTLRSKEANMLGYARFADLSLVTKMAQSPEQVQDFLEDLAQRARPYAEQEWEELQAFAAKELGLTHLEPWDITFAAEKLREARYAFSEQEVRQYFPEQAVLAGLFKVAQTLFNITIRPATAEVWHKDVRFFEVLHAQSGGLIAQFYLDLYARPGKRGGAWMDDARSRYRDAKGVLHTPVAYLTCNFSAPLADKPACFTHDDVITLFHEFGHGLHHMLTQIEDLAVSGIHGVEWDAVELPSQFMENFCWEWQELRQLTAHVDTGEPLPRALFDKMQAAKHFQTGLGTLRQIVFSLLDLKLHTDFNPEKEDLQTCAQTIHKKYNVLPQAPFSRTLNTFSHIFAGGYAAGYYSYKWAEVLSADAYAAFEEAAQRKGTPVLDPETGAHYRREILEVGGSRSAMDSFIAFRKREPRIDALLRHSGMGK